MNPNRFFEGLGQLGRGVLGTQVTSAARALAPIMGAAMERRSVVVAQAGRHIAGESDVLLRLASSGDVGASMLSRPSTARLVHQRRMGRRTILDTVVGSPYQPPQSVASEPSS